MARRIYCPVKEIPDERFQEAAEDHLGNYHYKVDTGNVSHILRTQSLLCACLPVGVYNHKEWAKVSEGFKTKLFRVVNMFTAPSPVDPDIPKHRLSLQYDGKYSMQIQNTDHKFSVLLQINLS